MISNRYILRNILSHTVIALRINHFGIVLGYSTFEDFDFGKTTLFADCISKIKIFANKIIQKEVMDYLESKLC